MSCEPIRRFPRHRRPFRSRLQLTAAAAALGAAVWACAESKSSEAPADVTLRVGLALPEVASGAGIGAVISALTGDRLVGFANDGRFEPHLARAWTWSEDRLSLTLELRRDLRFHDGSPVTSTDVEAFLKQSLTPAAGPGLSDVAAIEAPDPLHVILRLRRPSSFLLEDLGGLTVSRTIDGGSVGAGPYRHVATERSEDRIALEAFPEFFAGRPAIDRLEISSYPTVRSAWAAMLRDEIDMLHEVGREAVEFVEAESAVQVHSFPRPYVHTLGFNLRHPALQDPRVRQALNLAIDRDDIVRRALRGRGRVADGYVWPHHWVFDRSARSFRFDPGRAMQLLDEAGYRLRPDSEMSSRLRLNCILPSDWSPFEVIALVVQKRLFEIGVDLVLEPVPSRELGRRIPAGEYETFLYELVSPRGLGFAYRFLRSPGLMNSGYTAADTVLDRVRHARSDEDLKVAVADLQRVLYDDPPAVFISWDERARAVSRRFEVPVRPGVDVFTLLWQWKPAARPAN